VPYNKFNVVERGNGSYREEENKGGGKKPLRCWTSGGEHHRREFPLHQCSRPQIYSA